MSENHKRVYDFNPGPAALPLEVLQAGASRDAGLPGDRHVGHGNQPPLQGIREHPADRRSGPARIARHSGQLQGPVPAGRRLPAVRHAAHESEGRRRFSADYIVTGTWSKTAFKEAAKLGAVHRAAANLEAQGFNDLPAKLDLDPKAAYLHFTSNETIHGVEFQTEPEPPSGVPLVCDASSDFISRPIDVSKYALIYAGAQKNAGPAGVVIVIVRDDMLERTPANLPVMLDYKALAASGSLHNTPPCYAIYICGLVFKWAKQTGRPDRHRSDAIRQKAGLVYKTIDDSGGFYRGHAKPAARSIMNIPFRLPAVELEEAFASESKKNDLIGLKGHRSVGGMRASLYNALDITASEALTSFMREFQKKHG